MISRPGDPQLFSSYHATLLRSGTSALESDGRNLWNMEVQVLWIYSVRSRVTVPCIPPYCSRVERKSYLISSPHRKPAKLHSVLEHSVCFPPLNLDRFLIMSDRRRAATIDRDTNETKIQLSLSLDGGALEDAEQTGDAKSHAAQSSTSQEIDIDSGIGFLDHMIHALAKHAGWSLRLRCKGDLHST